MVKTMVKDERMVRREDSNERRKVQRTVIIKRGFNKRQEKTFFPFYSLLYIISF